MTEQERLDAHRYYAGQALRALIDRWDDDRDPERDRNVICHKAHVIADQMAATEETFRNGR